MTVDAWTNQLTVPAAGPTTIGDKTLTTGALQSQQEKTLTFTTLKAGTAGAKTFRALIDSRARILESNETNNAASRAWSIAQ